MTDHSSSTALGTPPSRDRMAPDTRPPDSIPPAGSGFLVYGARQTCKVSNSRRPEESQRPTPTGAWGSFWNPAGHCRSSARPPRPDTPGATRGAEWTPCLPEQTRPLGGALGHSLAQTRPEVTQATGGDRGRFSLWTFHWGRPAKGFAKKLTRPHHYGYTSKWLHSQRTRPKGPF